MANYVLLIPAAYLCSHLNCFRHFDINKKENLKHFKIKKKLLHLPTKFSRIVAVVQKIFLDCNSMHSLQSNAFQIKAMLQECFFKLFNWCQARWRGLNGGEFQHVSHFCWGETGIVGWHSQTLQTYRDNNEVASFISTEH